MKRRIAFTLLTLALLLGLCPVGAAADGWGRALPDDRAVLTETFTGVVTYRDGRKAYLQNGTEGVLALLDDGNDSNDLAAVQVGKMVTVTGIALKLNAGGYRVPEIQDAAITAVEDTAEVAVAAAASIAQLGNDLMARLVRVDAAKAELVEAGIQVDLQGFEDAEPLRVVGVLSADDQGRVLLGATVTALHLRSDPVQENEDKAGCETAGRYEEVVYCAVCGVELSRVEHTVSALGHAPGEAVQEEFVPPTVDREGGYDSVVYCTRCEKELKREHVVVDRLPMALPVISDQPRSAAVKSGHKATFSVKAKGKELGYRWYSRPSADDEWTLIPGETKASLSLVGAKANDGLRVRCGVYNAGGEVFSDEAILAVTLQPPVIRTQPRSAAAVAGKKVTFTVKASGKNLAYQWFRRGSAEEAWTAVDGAVKASYSFTAASAMNGTQFCCRVQNGDGQADSDAVTLAVAPVPPTVKTQPRAVTVKSGSKAKFSVKAAGPALQYQWYEQGAEGGEWVKIEGADKAEYAFAAPFAKNGCRYYCRVWNEDGSADSEAAVLRVTPQPPKFSTQPRDVKARVGTEVAFKVKVSDKAAALQWYYRTAADEPWILLEGETGAKLTVLAEAGSDGRQFLCRATNADGTTDSRIAALRLK